MRRIFFAVSVTLLFVQCSQEGTRRDFFNELKGYPDFASSKGQLPLFDFDNLVIDSLSTSIEGKKYWYLNTTSNALFNINGYIRGSDKVVYIRPGDKAESKSNKEQVLFDFSGNTTKSWAVQYLRNKVAQNLVIIENARFYNKLIKDSTVIFRVYQEVGNTSFSKEFLIQASLMKGLVSFKYLDLVKKISYTIDFLPSAKVIYDSVATPLYQVQ
jgi:hypothetical protein